MARWGEQPKKYDLHLNVDLVQVDLAFQMERIQGQFFFAENYAKKSQNNKTFHQEK
jgi:hypothetical protein